MAAYQASRCTQILGEFHPKHGEGVELSKTRRIATGKGLPSATITFSNDPICKGVNFSVKILQKSSDFVSPISAATIPHTLDAPYGWKCCACNPLLPIVYCDDIEGM